MCGSCGGNTSSGSTGQESKGCGACQLCCPSMRRVCCSPSCCSVPCCPSPCCGPSRTSSSCGTSASSTPRRSSSSCCCPAPFPCCNPCMPCCPPSGYSCTTKGPCPTACCGAKCNQIVTCCPKPTIQPIQIWGCTPHGCCNSSQADVIDKRGGGGFCNN